MYNVFNMCIICLISVIWEKFHPEKKLFSPPVGGEGGVVVSVAELVAGVGRRNRRSMHQVLERQHRIHAQLRRHQEPSLQHRLELALSRDHLQVITRCEGEEYKEEEEELEKEREEEEEEEERISKAHKQMSATRILFKCIRQ